MCGIALLWDERLPASERASVVVGMAERLHHRGPDARGLWHGEAPPITVAHRRLSIRGHGDQGAQPMQTADGRYVLSYNGELFGAEALRAELVRSGATFRGASDTEILLHSLALWGVDETLRRISGQFAFAWLDIASRRLFLARDRVGIRPLYYAAHGSRLAVASEQKSLLLLRWVDRTPRPESMLRYLVMGRTDDVPGETMLQGIRSLPAGHWAEWDGETLRLRRYFRAETPVERTSVAEVRSELERAVAEQLVSDVPVGAMVSGGLDSSAVVMMADRARTARGASDTFHLFAYHDELAEHDERPYQRAVLDAVRTPHAVHWVSSTPAKLATEFERYVDHQEEPYGDVSSYAEYCIAAEAARHGVKVVLSGLGGDEVFVGYGAYLGPLMLELCNAGKLGAAIDLLRVAPRIGSVRREQVLAAAVYHALPANLRNAVSAARASREANFPLDLAVMASRDAFRTWHRHDGRGPTNASLRGSLESWSVPRFLTHSDRMMLAFGVEGRVPLLDERLIRAAWGVPIERRLGASGLKASLRAAATDVLPAKVRDRAWKLGFHAPLPAYVKALEEPLRAGYHSTHDALGTAPGWEALGPHARWHWGNLGAYLSWVAQQPYCKTDAPLRLATHRQTQCSDADSKGSESALEGNGVAKP